MKRILITGASGYVARNLSLALAEHDLFLMSRSPIFKGVYKGIQASPSTVKELPSDLDLILHLASPDHAISEKSPELAHEVNIEGTKNLLKVAERSGAKQFVYFSTAHVYGSNLKSTVSESTLPSPTSVYGKTHLMAETLVTHHFANRFLVLRMSNLVGSPITTKGSHWRLACNDFCVQAVTKNRIQLQSPGDQRRNFVDISELKALLQQDLPNGLFNFGGVKQELSIYELAQMVKAMAEKRLNREIPVERPEGRSSESNSDLHYSSERLRSTVSLPEDGLTDAIDEVLDFCLQNQDFFRQIGS